MWSSRRTSATSAALARDFERGERLLRHAGTLDPSSQAAPLSRAIPARARPLREAWDLRNEAALAGKAARHGRAFTQPWWQGEPLGPLDPRLGQPGLGDEIMFANPVPDLVAMGARGARVRAAARAPVRALVSGVNVVPRGAAARARIERAARASDADERAAALPAALARVVSAASGLSARSAGARRVLAIAARASAPGEDRGFVVGRYAQTGKARRSTTLEDWLPVLRVPGVHYVSLQYTDCRADLARLRDQHGIGLVRWQEAIDDYDETAALVTALDAVASVARRSSTLRSWDSRPTCWCRGGPAGATSSREKRCPGILRAARAAGAAERLERAIARLAAELARR
jgi:hypothetical protein